MKKNDDTLAGFVAFVIVMFVIMIGVASSSSKEEEYKSTCIKSGCDRDCSDGSFYCFLHKPSSSSKKYNTNSGSGSSGSSSYKPSSSSSSSSGSSNKPSSSSSSSSAYDSHKDYDDGYNDIYEDGDYDWDRYYEDDDYASGVDDAMDDCEDEFGDDW